MKHDSELVDAPDEDIAARTHDTCLRKPESGGGEGKLVEVLLDAFWIRDIMRRTKIYSTQKQYIYIFLVAQLALFQTPVF